MARYSGALCRLCRREGEKLFLKGSKCGTAKCILDRRDFAPGQHGKGKSKLSEYGLQLREKQKLRRMYGITERQFVLCFRKASSMKGVTGDALLQLLETRLDNAIFQIGIAIGRRIARQIVRHGHITVNGRKVNIPSFQIKAGDVIGIKDKEGTKKMVAKTIEITGGRAVPEWVSFDKNTLTGKILRIPERRDISVPINENMIVELYSK